MQEDTGAMRDPRSRAHDDAERSGEELLQLIIDSVPSLVAYVGADGRYVVCNQAYETWCGRPRSQIVGRRVEEVVGEETWGTLRDHALAARAGAHATFECLLPAREGDSRWVAGACIPRTDAQGKQEGYVEILTDVSVQKRAVMLLSAERRVLELVAEGRPLGEVLTMLARTIEELTPGMRASVLVLDDDGLHLRHGAAPSLPITYFEVIEGLAIGPESGSCGAAAYHNQTVLTFDIETDPRWVPWRELALAHGLRACWSTPIRTIGDAVLGTFALYYTTPRLPEPGHLELIDAAAHVARIAIERHRADRERHKLIAELRRAQRT